MQDIFKKFKFRSQATVLNAPPELKQQFIQLECSTSLDRKKKSANTLVFVTSSKEYLQFLENDLKQIEHDSVLWFGYPRGTSRIKTDINRDTLRTTGERFGITTVTAISIDDTWSALRFRPIDRVGK